MKTAKQKKRTATNASVDDRKVKLVLVDGRSAKPSKSTPRDDNNPPPQAA